MKPSLTIVISIFAKYLIYFVVTVKTMVRQRYVKEYACI